MNKSSKNITLLYKNDSCEIQVVLMINIGKCIICKYLKKNVSLQKIYGNKMGRLQ